MYGINFQPQTNVATFNPIIELTDLDTGDLIDFSDIDITVKLYNNNDDCALTLRKGDSGLIIIDLGQFQINFKTLQRLPEGTYRVHCTFERDDTIRDLFAGNLPVVK